MDEKKSVFSRLFQGRKNTESPSSKWFITDKTGWSAPLLDKSQVRLVVFRDHDLKGRTLIFDSSSVHKTEAAPEQDQRRMCGFRYAIGRAGQKGPPDPRKDSTGSEGLNNSPKYSFSKQGSDTKVLGEMLFGSVAMAYKGHGLKVHITKSPPSLMVSKIFVPSKYNSESNMENEQLDSFTLSTASCETSMPITSNNSYDRLPTIAHSVPVDVPTPPVRHLVDDDSGISASLTSSTGSVAASVHSSLQSSSSSCSLASSSITSSYRRWLRNQTTSLEHTLVNRMSDEVLSNPVPMNKRPPKYGIGVLFALPQEGVADESVKQFQSFLFSHITLIEKQVENLQLAMEKALLNRKTFVAHLMEALDAFRTRVHDLYSAVRLPEPVWINMMCFATHRVSLCQRFLKEFMYVVEKFDNKNTNFFIGTLLTAVLTNHLAWVPTVVPAGADHAQAYLDKHSASWLEALAKSHPYNPLWAQLGDMYGAVGYPLRLSRTVIVGKKQDVVQRILYILTYFIRCSDLLEVVDPGYTLDDAEPDEGISAIFTESGSLGDSLEGSLNSTLSNQIESRKDADSASLKTMKNSIARSDCGMQLDSEMRNVDCTPTDVSTPRCLSPVEISDRCPECGLVMSYSSLQSHDDGKSVIRNDTSIADCDKESTDHVVLHSSTDNSNTCQLSTSVIMNNPRIENVSLVQHEVKSEEVLGLPQSVCVCKQPIKTAAHDSGVFVPQIQVDQDSDGVKFTLGAPLVTQTSDFDEYFQDSLDVENNGKMNGSNDIMDRYLQSLDELPLEEIKLDDTSKPCSRVPSHEGNLSLFDEYFSEDQPSPPEGACRDQVRSTLDLMRQVEKDNQETLTVNATSHNFTGARARQTSNISNKSKQSGVSRQISEQSNTNTLPQLSSLSGKENPRLRHVSRVSTSSLDTTDFLLSLREINMPHLYPDEEVSSLNTFDRNFGRSLMAGYSDHYMSDFVLQGTSDDNIQARIHHDLTRSVQGSVLDEPIAEAAIILADTDNWKVRLQTSQYSTPDRVNSSEMTASHLICGIIESVHHLWKLKMSPEFCLMHMEDRLQEIYFKSHMMVEYIKAHHKVDFTQLSAMLGLEMSDLPLLLAVAGTHSPHLASHLY